MLDIYQNKLSTGCPLLEHLQFIKFNTFFIKTLGKVLVTVVFDFHLILPPVLSFIWLTNRWINNMTECMEMMANMASNLLKMSRVAELSLSLSSNPDVTGVRIFLDSEQKFCCPCRWSPWQHAKQEISWDILIYIFLLMCVMFTEHKHTQFLIGYVHWRAN